MLIVDNNNIKKISIASDHAGYTLKELLKTEIIKAGIEVKDFGCFSTDSVDYPEFAKLAAKSVVNNESERAILVCGSGTGMAITANKIKGIRAANCWNKDIVELAVKHNNINILCMGARIIGFDLAIEIVQTFFNSYFEGGRHQKRIDKIEN